MQPRSVFWYYCLLYKKIPFFGYIEEFPKNERFSSEYDSDSQGEDEDFDTWEANDFENWSDSDDSGIDVEYDIDFLLGQIDFDWQDELELSDHLSKKSKLLTARGLSM